jgi:hypothetical protein
MGQAFRRELAGLTLIALHFALFLRTVAAKAAERLALLSSLLWEAAGSAAPSWCVILTQRHTQTGIDGSASQMELS